MFKGLLLLVALCALFAFASSRPLLFYADQTDGFFNISKGWTGVAFAYATFKKGQLNHRVQVGGTNHINETLTGAWLMFANGTKIATLNISTSSSAKYFLGDVLLNQTYFDYLLQEKIYATVASTNHRNGAISGYYRCRPHSGLAYLDAAEVPSGSNSTAVGIGWAAITASVFTTGIPSDIATQDADITATSTFSGRIVHNVTGTTNGTFNAPANTTSTAPALAVGALSGTFSDVFFDSVPVTEDFFSIDTANAYYLVTGSKGNIRGQIYPLVSPTRRSIPLSIQQVNGNTVVPSAGLGTLRYANQIASDNNKNSYISLISTANPTNFTYQAVFTFKGATSRKNFELVRGLTVELNARIVGTGDWFFEFFDSTTSTFIPAGIIASSDATEWTPLYIEYISTTVSDFANNRKELILRVSTNSNVQTTLALDLFGVRSYIPSSNTLQVWKTLVKLFETLPAK